MEVKNDDSYLAVMKLMKPLDVVDEVISEAETPCSEMSNIDKIGLVTGELSIMSSKRVSFAEFSSPLGDIVL